MLTLLRDSFLPGTRGGPGPLKGLGACLEPTSPVKGTPCPSLWTTALRAGSQTFYAATCRCPPAFVMGGVYRCPESLNPTCPRRLSPAS
jgi:hypothetical protein